MRCVIYARLSVSNEQSVSISRQIESCQKYAEARGWEVVAEPFVDDGVSASKNKPAERAGWKALLASAEPYDLVLVWKVDRLARRITDFWKAYEVLDARGRSLASVADNLDMSTTIGQIVAGVLAGFAQMEAEAISARVAAARTHLLLNGRSVGGGVPFGWRNVPNPDGPGMVIAKDPERIGYVEEMVARTLAGRSIYSTARWLSDASVPTPSGAGTAWGHATVERLLRHPLVAGMVPFNPGRDSKRRGDGVLLGENDLPVVRDDLAVMPVARWRAMLAALDAPQEGKNLPRALAAKSSGVLSGLVLCGEHEEPVRMYRGVRNGNTMYSCPECHQAMINFEHIVVEDFLARASGQARWRPMEKVFDGPGAMLPEIEVRLTELGRQIASASDRERRLDLLDQIDALQELKATAEAAPGQVRYESEPVGFFEDDWAAATDDAERRAIIGDALVSVTVRRGSRGRTTDDKRRERLEYAWAPGLVQYPHDPASAA
ncbi:recombinase family protein [Demequina oxidasica]|uniref:recombinase family protein n=1 Tax=Demequina oxidasica TaxID=676199 RepID=UPI000A03F80A|nr:recombinase family protein [Demequina oxidasica]